MERMQNRKREKNARVRHRRASSQRPGWRAGADWWREAVQQTGRRAESIRWDNWKPDSDFLSVSMQSTPYFQQFPYTLISPPSFISLVAMSDLENDSSLANRPSTEELSLHQHLTNSKSGRNRNTNGHREQRRRRRRKPGNKMRPNCNLHWPPTHRIPLFPLPHPDTPLRSRPSSMHFNSLVRK